MDAQSSWDSEKRNSPYSTVSDIEDEYCDNCGDAHTCSDCKPSDKYHGIFSGQFDLVDGDEVARS